LLSLDKNGTYHMMLSIGWSTASSVIQSVINKFERWQSGLGDKVINQTGGRVLLPPRFGLFHLIHDWKHLSLGAHTQKIIELARHML